MNLCAVARCEKPVTARGWCNGHYERWRKTGNVGDTPLEGRRVNVNRRCGVDACGREAFARGWCESHYAYWHRTGEVPEHPIAEIGPLPDRFWSKVTQAEGCWVWEGAVGGGYGKFAGVGGTTTAHRIAYELANGPIPDGMHVDHLCRNTLCVNPNHLEAVTQAENNRRAGVARSS